MPELPEVETVRRGLEKIVKGKILVGAEVRQTQLRLPVPKDLSEKLTGAKIHGVSRRAKYILIRTSRGTLINHLGMTGSWRQSEDSEVKRHDHVLLKFKSNPNLVFNDPRRFGLLDWTPEGQEMSHPWLSHLGVEPLTMSFNTDYLYLKTRKRRCSIKSLLMNQKIVVGVGNIYVAEALFKAGVRPSRGAGKVTRAECARIVTACRRVLERAIAKGGTTIRDFKQAGGGEGYFQLHLNVYGRKNEPCRTCRSNIKHKMVGGRSSFWCTKCQK